MMMHTTLTPLRLARVHAQLPQYVLAKRARICASRLSNLERGYSEPNGYERAALARVLGIAQEELFPIPVEPVGTTGDAPGTGAMPAPEPIPAH